MKKNSNHPTIEIRCKGSDSANYREIQKFQGNLKRVPERNLIKLKESIVRNGFRIPIFMWHGKCMDGHSRIMALESLEADGYTIPKIPVYELQAKNEQDAKKLLLLINSRYGIIREKGFFEFAEDLDLSGLVGEIEIPEIELALDSEGEKPEDIIPPVPGKAKTKRGQIFQLGNHRLMCGDSSLPDDLDRLLNGARIQLVNTDPPYNVKVEPRSNNAIASGLSSFTGIKHHQSFDMGRFPEKSKPTTKKLRAKDRALINDFLPDEEFCRLLHAWFGNIARVLEPGRSFYIWGGYANIGNYPAVLKAHGLYFSQAIIWDKEWPVLTRKDFMGAHEWCMYGWKEGAAHKFFGEPNTPDLWHVKKTNPTDMVHLTEKPVELAVRAMVCSSKERENVLDLFGGSGSTLIAAEMIHRHAFLMELDPLYCDVIIKRWQDFTNKKAVIAA